MFKKDSNGITALESLLLRGIRDGSGVEVCVYASLPLTFKEFKERRAIECIKAEVDAEFCYLNIFFPTILATLLHNGV